MSAYAIGQITVKDSAKWAEYRGLLSETLVPWGGEILLRGKQAKVLSGQYRHSDTVVIRFPDMESLQRWHDSPAYQALVPLRDSAADVDLIRYEADS
jgi:uncharacterized protein (DUF1330 family)